MIDWQIIRPHREHCNRMNYDDTGGGAYQNPFHPDPSGDYDVALSVTILLCNDPACNFKATCNSAAFDMMIERSVVGGLPTNPLTEDVGPSEEQS